ncbi:alkyl hydroperoxide reductase AhpD [Betaproteobacteria bacterium]|nr:alkyl hydroperoxide reductase AhpD [Betaproteobacteria bacterium]GHT95778.1 alkyl hydroperoxide reductase AhpD [Betaproteobacteria bacterium]GHU00226.1 alkyl hydroperoxide reductase AhpD [Betaproteobacteria bacterium]GHU01213.1 alkyl hydroperoxide reductase AhpD [Betaproteobacteria bacterium]GHU12362.1 alkyl hydroperoxide reductase AhpD [Betaproteobacteria bacterium]
MSTTQFRDTSRTIMGRMNDLGKAIPGVMQGFQALHEAASANGVLSSKTKELIALAIAVAARCEGCVAFHAKEAVKQGATRAEVTETLGVAIQMGGGPSMMWATEALAAFDEFSAPQA